MTLLDTILLTVTQTEQRIGFSHAGKVMRQHLVLTSKTHFGLWTLIEWIKCSLALVT